MKKQTLRIGAMLCVITLFATACGTKIKSSEPSSYRKISETIGLSQMDVYEKLGITEDNVYPVTNQNGLYGIAEEAEYSGYTFKTQLGFDMTSNQKELMSIWYVLDLNQDSFECEEVVLKLLDELKNSYGDYMQSNIQEGKEGRSSLTVWDIKKQAEDNVTTYCKDLEKQYGGESQFLVELEVRADDELPQIIIRYVTKVIGGKLQ